MVMEIEVLEEIRAELRELRLLYKQLLEKLIPIVDPTPEEREAIEKEDELVKEKELMKALDKEKCST